MASAVEGSSRNMSKGEAAVERRDIVKTTKSLLPIEDKNDPFRPSVSSSTLSKVRPSAVEMDIIRNAYKRDSSSTSDERFDLRKELALLRSTARLLWPEHAARPVVEDDSRAGQVKQSDDRRNRVKGLELEGKVKGHA